MMNLSHSPVAAGEGLIIEWDDESKELVPMELEPIPLVQSIQLNNSIGWRNDADLSTCVY